MAGSRDVFDNRGNFIGEVHNNEIYPKHKDYFGGVYDSRGNKIGEISRTGSYNPEVPYFPAEPGVPSSLEGFGFLLLLLFLFVPVAGMVYGTKYLILGMAAPYKKWDHFRYSALATSVAFFPVFCAFFPLINTLAFALVCFLLVSAPLALMALPFLLSREPIIQQMPNNDRTKHIVLGEVILTGMLFTVAFFLSLPIAIPLVVEAFR